MIALTTHDQRLASTDPTSCPRCSESNEGRGGPGSAKYEEAVQAAAHCCLWKEIAHPVRDRIAGRVNLGATWLEALQAEGVA